MDGASAVKAQTDTGLPIRELEAQITERAGHLMRPKIAGFG
jgi:hypothetical protein